MNDQQALDRYRYMLRTAPPDDVERARNLLFEAREGRRRPGLDDKVLTEWNALMISSLAEAGSLQDEPSWIDAAGDAAHAAAGIPRSEASRHAEQR